MACGAQRAETPPSRARRRRRVRRQAAPQEAPRRHGRGLRLGFRFHQLDRRPNRKVLNCRARWLDARRRAGAEAGGATEAGGAEAEAGGEAQSRRAHAADRERRQRARSSHDRWEGYCGGIPELVKFAKKHGNSGGMSTLQVQNWYKRNPHKLPTWLQGHAFSVDHLISDKLGGHPFVFNYFVMPKSTNAKFGMYLTREKEDYVGPSAFTYACQFARWCRNTTRAYVDYSDFDPIVDSYIGRA